MFCHALKRLFPIVLCAIAVSGCGGSAGAPIQSLPQLQQQASATETATAAQTAAQSNTSRSIVWRAGDDERGRWGVATTLQCGRPVQSGSRFVMAFSQGHAPGGGRCGRNQANPLEANTGNVVRLDYGRQYTWTFVYIDGTPGGGPGMGYDRDARSLIWQIAPYVTGSDCTQLWLDNGGVVGHPEEWDLKVCGRTVYHGKYTPDERDDFKIVVVPSEGDSGRLTFYRNGTKVGEYHGQNVAGSSGAPWWNFGPYKWVWEEYPNHSTMRTAGATFESMQLTSP